MSDAIVLEARLNALEIRLRRAEDLLAIYQLIASYGPAVDSGDAAATGALWADDGTYDWGGGPPEKGPEGLAAMVEGAMHQGIIAGGAGHVLSLPKIEIRGEEATAINYSRLYRRDGEGFVVYRLAANRWELVRTKAGWKVKSRVNRLLKGEEEARAILNDFKR